MHKGDDILLCAPCNAHAASSLAFTFSPDQPRSLFGTRFAFRSFSVQIWFDDMGYDRAVASIQRSLRNLRTDHLDLLLIHYPGSPDAVQARVQ